MIDLKDFVFKPNGKAGLIRFYKGYCNLCKADRGYIRKRHEALLCSSCSHIEDFPSNVNKADFKQEGSKRLYRINCKKCCSDKGYMPLWTADRVCHSCNMLDRWSTGGMNNMKYSKRSFSYVKQHKTINFKSSWELKYAQYLDKQGIEWCYEPIFSLSNGTNYLPDFKLGDGVIVEIKGYFRPDAIVKWDLFCKEYPTLHKKLLTKVDLEALDIL